MIVLIIIGIIVAAFLVVFLLLSIIYALFRKKADPFVSPDKMPILRPIPIPTKNRCFFMRILVWFFDVRHWKLEANWCFKFDNGDEIIFPKGFIFDGASIPRPLWTFLSPVGLLLIPGLIHDYGYKYDQLWTKDEKDQVRPYREGAGRKYWDYLFKAVGKEVNGFSFIDYLAWLAVKLGGGFAWRAHRKNNKQPKKPII